MTTHVQKAIDNHHLLVQAEAAVVELRDARNEAVVAARFVDDLSVPEIARQVGMNQDTVRSILRNRQPGATQASAAG